jgi:DNA-binding Xre family transcriptional regulator
LFCSFGLVLVVLSLHAHCTAGNNDVNLNLVDFPILWKIVVPGGTVRYNARMKTISQQAFDLLCHAIEKKGWSINAIAIAAGVSRVGLQRWYSGNRDSINTETLDGLCRWFGVRLTAGKIPKPPETHHRKPTRKGAGK